MGKKLLCCFGVSLCTFNLNMFQVSLLSLFYHWQESWEHDRRSCLGNTYFWWTDSDYMLFCWHRLQVAKSSLVGQSVSSEGFSLCFSYWFVKYLLPMSSILRSFIYFSRQLKCKGIGIRYLLWFYIGLIQYCWSLGGALGAEIPRYGPVARLSLRWSYYFSDSASLSNPLSTGS